MPAGLCAIGPLSRMQTNSAWAPNPLHAEDPVADLELVDGCADRLDLTGELHARGSCRFGRRKPVKKRQMKGLAREVAVRPVDGRRVDPDEHLVVVRDGPLDVLEPQHLRRPVAVVDDGSHRAAPRSP